MGKKKKDNTSNPDKLSLVTHDMEFVAKMLHTFVVIKNNKYDFHICEAYEVAKKYLKPEEEHHDTSEE